MYQVSLIQYPNEEKTFRKFFFEIFLKSSVSHIELKNVKGGLFGIFRTSIVAKYLKKLRGDIKKNCEKKSHKAEITCTKNFGQGRDSNPRHSAWQTSKNPD